MNIYAAFALALVAGCVPARSDAAGIRALLCNGCSAAKEQSKALAAPDGGYVVVYNVTDRRVRKFEVVVTKDGGDATPLGGKAYGGTLVAPADAAAHALWEYPIDPSVQTVFDAIVALDGAEPGFLAGKGAVTVPIRTLGPASDEPNAPLHDPRLIAWHWPPAGGSAYGAFDDRIDRMFEDATTAGRFDARVGKALFGVQRASKTAGLSIGRAGLAIGVDFESVAKLLKVKLCDDNDTCVRTSVTFNDFPAHENVVDRYGVVLPSMQPRTFRVEWPSNARDGAYAYATWLRANRAIATVDDKTGGKTTCGGYVLVCERQASVPRSNCRLECR